MLMRSMNRYRHTSSVCLANLLTKGRWVDGQPGPLHIFPTSYDQFSLNLRSVVINGENAKPAKRSACSSI